MAARRLLRDVALVDQRLHIAVVTRQLLERAVAEQVGPRVADVEQAVVAAAEQEQYAERIAVSADTKLMLDCGQTTASRATVLAGNRSPKRAKR